MTGQDNETIETDSKDNANVADSEVTVEQADAETATNQANNEERQTDITDELETLRILLEKEQEQTQAHLDTALRAQAEMENLRKRTFRDVENAHKYALEKFVGELIPVVDSMELGLSVAAGNDQGKDLIEGMELTLKMLRGALEKFGVKQIMPEGKKFNPEFHEAVSMQEIDGKESGTVVAVMQKGYELNGRLVRAAMVMVAK